MHKFSQNVPLEKEWVSDMSSNAHPGTKSPATRAEDEDPGWAQLSSQTAFSQNRFSPFRAQKSRPQNCSSPTSPAPLQSLLLTLPALE